MRHLKRIFFLVLLLTSIFASASCAAELENIHKDRWMGIYLSGAKIGYGRFTAQSATLNGEDVYRVDQEEVVFDDGATIRSMGVTYIGADFRPILETYEHPVLDRHARRKIEIRYTPGLAEYTARLGDNVERKSIPIPADVDLSTYCRYLLDLKRPGPGERLVMATLDSRSAKLGQVTAYLNPRSKVDIKGKTMEATPLVSETDKRIITSWYLDDWTLVKTEIGSVWVIPESREEAMSGLSKGPIPIQDSIKTDKDIFASVTKPEDHQRLTTLEFRLTNIDDPKLAITDSRQAATYLPDKKAIDYRIIARRVDSAKAAKLPIKDVEVQKWLQPSTYVQSDYPQIAKLARKIVGQEANSYKAAQKLRSWMRANIRPTRNTEVYFSAKDVLKAKQGDCKHFSVLYTALARAAGIPARVVMGVMYKGENEFGYHCWVECFLGEWTPVDATSKWDFVNASYVKFIEIESDDLGESGSRIVASKDASAQIKSIGFDPPIARP